MGIVKRITAYGTPGVIATGAAVIWGQSLLVWVTQPSHLIVVGGVAATAAAARAVSKGKAKPEQAPQAVAAEPTQETLATQAQAYLDSLRAQARALPKPTQVIDYTAAGQEVTRVRKV